MSSNPQRLTVVMPPEDEPPDETLVVASQAGDRDALDALVRRHQQALFGLCLRYVKDTDEAADLTQKAFVRAMTKLDDLRTPALFRAWLLRIAAHLALNHIRDHARFVSDDDDMERLGDGARAGGDTVVDRMAAAENAAALRAAVRMLPTKQRMTLELRVYEALSFRDIAAALGISEGAAKVNFHYAVRKLRTHLGPQPDGVTRRGKVK